MRILITGGTGSLGNALADRLLPARIERLVILSRDELKQAQMADRLDPSPALRFFLGDVRDRARLVEAFHSIDVVIHAAALKRVDAIAYSPGEVIKTNVLGTMNVVQAAIEAGVGRVLLISSDKAVQATNIYGASKFMAECAAIQGNASGYPRGTKIAAIRYGNVLASRGSVVHIFREAVRLGVPIPITDPRCTRFFLTLDQAVDIVLAALGGMEGGEVFVPLLPSMKIVDLAEAVAPGHPTVTVGLRAGGEKLSEQLLSEEETSRALRDIGIAGTPELLLVQPTHRSWASDKWIGKPLPEGFVYRSDLNEDWLSVAALREMLA